MNNVLTQSPNIQNGLHELLGDANGEPPDGAAILQLAHRARQAKTAGNRNDWRDATNELLWTARKSQLAQQKKMFDIEKKHQAEMDKLLKGKNEVELKLASNTRKDKAIELFQAGKTGEALLILGSEGVEANALAEVGEWLYREAALKAQNGDKRAEAWLHTLYATEGFDPKLAGQFVYDRFLKQHVEGIRDPKILGQTEEPPVSVDTLQQEMSPVGGQFLPQGVPTLTPGHQQALDANFTPSLPQAQAQAQTQTAMPEQPQAVMPEQQAQAPLAPQQAQGMTPVGGWNEQDYENFRMSQGITEKQSGSESAQLQIYQDLTGDGGVPRDEAARLVLGKQATIPQKRDWEMKKEEILRMYGEESEEYRDFLNTAAKAEKETKTAKQKEWNESIEPSLEKLGVAKYSPEWTEKFMTHYGLDADPERMKVAEKIALDPKLLDSDKDALLAIAQLPRSVNTPDAIGAAHLEVQRIRQRQGALFGNMETYSKDPQTAIKKAVETAKQEGRFDALLDTIFPDRDKGLGIMITNKLFPTSFDRQALEVIKRNANVQSVGIGTKKLVDAEKLARDLFSLLAYFKHAIDDDRIYQSWIPYAVRSKLTGLGALMGRQPITNAEVEAAAHAGEAFALFMNFISGAAVSEPEAKRLGETFIRPGDPEDMSQAKIRALFSRTRDGLINHYSTVLNNDLAKQITEFVIDESYNPENRTNGTVSDWIRSLGDRSIEKMTYNQIFSKLTSEASTFMKSGEEFTKSQLSGVRNALKGIREQKLTRAGNPETLFTQTLTEAKAEQLQNWIADIDDPINLFASITDWLPIDLSNDAATIELNITGRLDKFEDQYIRALKKAGKYTETLKGKLATEKTRLDDLKRTEIFAFKRETASKFIDDARADKVGILWIEKYGEAYLRELWLNVQKRGF